MTRPAALGFRVKSGRAAAVLLAGPPTAPEVADSCTVPLSDPAIPATTQPYHAAFGRAQENAARIRELVRIVLRCGHRSVRDLLKRYRTGGYEVRRIALVIGSDIDPARIANQHIRAHANEGRLFRTAVETGATRSGLETRAFIEKHLLKQAAEELRRSEAGLKRTLEALGDPVAGPWRADQKMAALAAWLMLNQSRRR